MAVSKPMKLGLGWPNRKERDAKLMALEDEVRRTGVLLPLTEDYSDVVQSTRLSISLLTRIHRSERRQAQSIIPSPGNSRRARFALSYLFETRERIGSA